MEEASPMRRIPGRATALAAGLTLVGGLAACAPQPTEPTIDTLSTNVQSYAISGNWNPVTSTYLNTYFAPQQAPYETLVRLNGATFEFEPFLAESYEIGDDQRTMDLVLLEDVDFTDGTHLDAETAKRSIDLAAQGATFSGFFELNEIEIEVTGEYGLRVTSSRPMNPDFLYNFAIIPIVSPTAIEEDPTGLESTPVGTGPYVLDEQVPEVSISFVRNPDYRDPEAYPFDRLEFLIFDDDIAASNALKTGQINVALFNSSLAADGESEGFVVHAGSGTNFLLWWQDTAGTVVPALADVRVRQAIAYAIDRQAIADTLDFGYSDVISQAFGEGAPQHLEGEDDHYAFDVDKARELLAEAGYADGFDLAIPSYSGTSKYDPVLIQSFADIGIRLTIDEKPDRASWSEAIVSGDYALFLAQQADLFLNNSLRPKENGADGDGFRQLADAFDKLDNGTPAEAAEANQEIGRIVLDEALLIPVARPLQTWVSVPEIVVAPGIIQLWPPLLSSYQLAD